MVVPVAKGLLHKVKGGKDLSIVCLFPGVAGPSNSKNVLLFCEAQSQLKLI